VVNNGIYLIFPNGIFVDLLKINSNPFFFDIWLDIWILFYSLNLHGICLQFIYRYLILNR